LLRIVPSKAEKRAILQAGNIPASKQAKAVMKNSHVWPITTTSKEKLCFQNPLNNLIFINTK
jgi:hypothetical protein